VQLDRGHGNPQRLGDLLVGLAQLDQAQHFLLARRQPRAQRWIGLLPRGQVAEVAEIEPARLDQPQGRHHQLRRRRLGDAAARSGLVGGLHLGGRQHGEQHQGRGRDRLGGAHQLAELRIVRIDLDHHHPGGARGDRVQGVPQGREAFGRLMAEGGPDQAGQRFPINRKPADNDRRHHKFLAVVFIAWKHPPRVTLRMARSHDAKSTKGVCRPSHLAKRSNFTNSLTTAKNSTQLLRCRRRIR
jgi:hypothetical protein